jgi:hypothetical protein
MAEASQNARTRGGMVGGQGRRRALQLAAEAEAERQREAQNLLDDLGREPSHSERVIVEQLTTLIVRGRRLRAVGRGADAEMVARLVMRGVTKLGIRQGAAKPVETPLE